MRAERILSRRTKLTLKNMVMKRGVGDESIKNWEDLIPFRTWPASQVPFGFHSVSKETQTENSGCSLGRKDIWGLLSGDPHWKTLANIQRLVDAWSFTWFKLNTMFNTRIYFLLSFANFKRPFFGEPTWSQTPVAEHKQTPPTSAGKAACGMPKGRVQVLPYFCWWQFFKWTRSDSIRSKRHLAMRSLWRNPSRARNPLDKGVEMSMLSKEFPRALKKGTG